MKRPCSAALYFALALACGSGDGTDSFGSAVQVSAGQHPDPDYALSKTLENVGSHALSVYQDFAERAALVEQAVADYAGSLATGDRESAQSAWREAMGVWQQAELLRFGPAGDVTTPGGLGIGDEIYSWVVSTNACRVDQETTLDDHADPSAVASKPINVRGLDALEYLLFNDDAGNQCAANLSINTAGTWAAIQDEVVERRAQQALALSIDLRRRSQALVDAWDPDGGGFAASFSRPDGNPYDTERDVLSAVAGATLYLDTQTKDRKVGVPGGVVNCSADTCPDSVESPFAGMSRQSVRANLESFQLIFNGGSNGAGYGLSDELMNVGADDLAEALSSDVQASLDAVDALGDATLREALTANVEGVRALYDSIKAVTDRIKGELVDELGLELTDPGAGDAD